MSENTFRAVVAAVLVGTLALAVVLAAILVPRPPEPRPSPTATPIAPTPAPSSTATPIAGPVFEAPRVVGVGEIRAVRADRTLVFEFVETTRDAILNAPGTYRVTISDHAGDGSSVSFVGTPSVEAPGSLGVTIALAAPNVLLVEIVASDPLEIEPITISGLGIKASATAATGPVAAEVDNFTGSMAGGLATDPVPSLGSVIANT